MRRLGGIRSRVPKSGEVSGAESDLTETDEHKENLVKA